MRSEKLIVALDVPSEEEAKNLIRQLKKDVSFFKVGLQLYTACGPKILSYLHKSHLKSFLDLKFFDVPSTVGKACMEATKKGVDMFNLHALGGREMVERAVDATTNIAAKLDVKKPLILVVTVLTSVKDLGEVGINMDMASSVTRFARMAKEAGADGVVCAPTDIEMVRRECGEEFVIVTPGIRLPDQAADDQVRVATPATAIKAGANYIVVGRPILKSPDPVAAVQMINASIHDMKGWAPPVTKSEETGEGSPVEGSSAEEQPAVEETHPPETPTSS